MVQMAWTEDSDGNNGREKLVGENGFLKVSEPSSDGSVGDGKNIG